MDVVTSLKHSSGAFKNKLTFNFSGTKETGCGYTTAQENTNTANFSNGLGARLKVKAETIQAQADFATRSLPQGITVNPYIRFDLNRTTFTGNPSLGALFFFRDLKWHILTQLATGDVAVRSRLEYIFRQNQLKIHFSKAAGYNPSKQEWLAHKTQLTANFDKFEGSVRVEQSKAAAQLKAESLFVGAAYIDPAIADFSARVKLDPLKLSEGVKDLHFGVAKRFAPNLAAKARFSWFSKVGSYYASFKPHNNLTVSGTIELSHLADQPTKGCCEYPFNFGLELAFNA